MITEITSIDHFKQIIRQDKISVVDYHASWSGPSKAFLPTFSQLAARHQKINFYKVDVDEHAQLSQEAGARIYPTFVVYRGGTKLQTIIGANPECLENALRL